jgi:hypothetical protein
MILGYAARNAVNPFANAGHIDKFTQLAHKQDPQLAQKMPAYRKIAGEVASRLEGLDPDRRRLAHDDLNRNLLKHVSTALTTGQTKPAIQAIHSHLHKLAGQYGVPVDAAYAPGQAVGQPAPGPQRV